MASPAPGPGEKQNRALRLLHTAVQADTVTKFSLCIQCEVQAACFGYRPGSHSFYLSSERQSSGGPSSSEGVCAAGHEERFLLYSLLCISGAHKALGSLLLPAETFMV